MSENKNDKVVESLNDGKVVVIYSEASKKLVVPLFCPLCDFPMKTKEDSTSFKDKGCCEKCDLQWRTHPNFDLGIEAFKDVICVTDSWTEYHIKRNNQSKHIINIK